MKASSALPPVGSAEAVGEPCGSPPAEALSDNGASAGAGYGRFGIAMPLSNEDVRAIEAVHRRWIALEKAGNAEAVLDCCADDVLWMPPDTEPLRGRQAIRSWLSGPPVLIEEIEISGLAIAGDGRVAWKTCDFVTVSRAAGAADPTVSRGSHLWILRRHDDGEWRVVVVTWTLI